MQFRIACVADAGWIESACRYVIQRQALAVGVAFFSGEREGKRLRRDQRRARLTLRVLSEFGTGSNRGC